MQNFDTFIGIDWSGAKTPINTKSISVAICEKDRDAPMSVNPQNHKYWSRRDVFNYINKIKHTKRRVLIGVDANFGYAYAVGSEQFSRGYYAQDLWAAVDQSCLKQDNFFAENFWEKYPQYFWTYGKKPEHITLPRRKIETVCGESGLGWPESPFKLIGPKQVGKGGLSVMRMAHNLKKEHGDEICIWPFEQRIEDTARIVITEIYPRQFLKRSGHGNTKVKTLSDLNIALEYFNSAPIKCSQELTDHDTDALISAAGMRWLCGDGKYIPSAISNPTKMDDKAALCEGWIFGV